MWMSSRWTGRLSRLGGQICFLGMNLSRRLFGRVAVRLFEPGGNRDRRLQLFVRDRFDDLAAMIEQIARAVLLEHRAKHPAVAMEIGELRVLRPGVEVGQVRQELADRSTGPGRPLRRDWTSAF